MILFKWTQFRLIFRFALFVQKASIIFALSNENGNRLCWGASCQGYIWPIDEKVKRKDWSVAVLLAFPDIVYALKKPIYKLHFTGFR